MLVDTPSSGASHIVLKYVKNQTDEICKIAIQQNKYASQYVKTDEICKISAYQIETED